MTMIRQEKLHCVKCRSTIEITAITDRHSKPDKAEIERLKQWHRTHGGECVATEAKHEEVII